MEQKQRKLDIAGKLELSVWPDVGIKLGRLTLSEPGGKEGVPGARSARVAVAVMPLLSKQVQVQRIEVDGLKATLVKRKDGTLNIADLTGGDRSEKPRRKSAPARRRPPVQLDIAGIKVANAQFTWRDEKTGSTTALSNLDLGSGRVQADSAKHTWTVDALSLAAKGKTGADSLRAEARRTEAARFAGEVRRRNLNLDATLSGSGRSLAAKLCCRASRATPRR
jgi:AsmA protein